MKRDSAREGSGAYFEQVNENALCLGCVLIFRNIGLLIRSSSDISIDVGMKQHLRSLGGRSTYFWVASSITYSINNLLNGFRRTLWLFAFGDLSCMRNCGLELCCKLFQIFLAWSYGFPFYSKGISCRGSALLDSFVIYFVLLLSCTRRPMKHVSADVGESFVT